MPNATQQHSNREAMEPSGLLADVAQMIELRRQLAEAEVRSDIGTTKRLAVVGGSALAATLTGLPLLVGILLTRIDKALGNAFPWVTLLCSLLFITAGCFAAWLAWRRFRRDFLGLRESMQELQEDLVWLRERWDRG